MGLADFLHVGRREGPVTGTPPQTPRQILEQKVQRSPELARALMGDAFSNEPIETGLELIGRLAQVYAGERGERKRAEHEQELTANASSEMARALAGYGSFPTMAEVNAARPADYGTAPLDIMPPGATPPAPPAPPMTTFDPLTVAGNAPITGGPTTLAPGGGSSPTRLDFGYSSEGLVPEFDTGLQSFLSAAPPGVRVISDYRSEDEQRAIYNRMYGETRAAHPDWSDAQIRRSLNGRVATPGNSNHQHGTAVDLRFETPEAEQWVRAHAAQYGMNFPLPNSDPNHMEWSGGGSAPSPVSGGSGGNPGGAGMFGAVPFRYGPVDGARNGQLAPQPSGPNMQGLIAALANPNLPDFYRQLGTTLLDRAMTPPDPTADLQEINGQLVNVRTGQVVGDYRDQPAGGPRPPIEINGQLVDPTTYEVVGDYRDPDVPAGPDVDGETKLRGEYLRGAGNFTTVADAYGRIQAAMQDDTNAGHIATVYAFMKMLDPGSVVRESEYATAENAAGVPDQIRNLWNRILQGERLAPELRANIMQQAGRQWETAQARQASLDDQYRGLATQYGYDPSRVVINLGGGLPAVPPAVAAPAPVAGPAPPVPPNTTVIPRAEAGTSPPAPALAPPSYPADDANGNPISYRAGVDANGQPTLTPVAPPAAPAAPAPTPMAPATVAPAPAPSPAPAAAVAPPTAMQPFASVPPDVQTGLRDVAARFISLGMPPDQIIERLAQRGFIVTLADLGL